MFNKTKTILVLFIATSNSHLLGMATAFIQNKTGQDIQVIFKYEGHGKIEETNIILSPNEKKEYKGFIPGCILTTITFRTVTTNKQTAIIRDKYGNFDITFIDGFLTARPSNN